MEHGLIAAEADPTLACCQDFSDGDPHEEKKATGFYVRAIRTF